ncbi:gcvT, glycine cleavage T protein (aminomethyl transferase) [Bradyrhizobium sp. ORS 285]|uniref:CAF17-like 4Fe-4S cluster assembly/insertion protein YgfZ n=1 Tax=Bradyrhizobium sp. ORS 285 TaxID=115808 RepID=UPI0002405629|nr:folate-binding protein YgfZ [Bradyrhizobium sp. ORS 285]CCD85357.1 putative glycine cleavage T protein (aminomethyl transferase) [Bradyrhizobium sp. ORS 285]SMX60056.1 gcvT, glycine cleavage T protein (aminomethyl transferase) [Bradyrhizobium sp. ORS 285]
MKATFLDDRGVVQVSGDDARKFLNGLVTTDVTKLVPGDARFGALLTPQGKIIIDFLVTEVPASDGGERFLLDVPRALAQALTDKLNVYKLRAKVAVSNLSAELGVIAVWDGAVGTMPEQSFTDPRHARLGARVIASQDALTTIATQLGAEIVDADAYEAHRIACSVPRGGLDFMYGDAFPYETNMDRLHGVDIGKGCYVGQEVVSRMHHRGTTRTRTAQVVLDGPSPEPGTPILAGEKSIGTMGSAAQQKGIALVRIDRVAEAMEAGTPLTAGGLTLRIADPDALQGAPKQTVA